MEFLLGPDGTYACIPAEARNKQWVQEEIDRLNSRMWNERARQYYKDSFGKTPVELLIDRMSDEYYVDPFEEPDSGSYGY